MIHSLSISFLLVLVLTSKQVFSQEIDIGVQYGRFWAPYGHQDFGTGLRKTPQSNYNFFPSVTVSKYYSNKLSGELGVFITLYQQYFGTRKYKAAFASQWGAGHVILRAGYSFIRKQNFEIRAKAGIGLGIAPDMYEGEFREMFVYPYVDSISRGTIKRNFTPVFPTVSTGIDLSYKLAKRFKVSLAGNYTKGFVRITEYDIYYNDGSGSNDQRAKQWGTGDFYGIQLGIRYQLRDEKGHKAGKK